ncbi:Zinc D-Ala-D-Ala carboxypeptidase [Madurella mycetomatis]|uniref:Zinc D-Ala-D-Ala carboxypeptidase n=1 Tax=Madurella mycetomatis TaxID=100816 RepID=A0A175W3Q9_9PEZI|nr:Zinc D-Ala-D-Ala carboxypeptidase [Madurella mycetomatis]
MKSSIFLSIIALTATGTADPTVSPRADGYCNTVKNVKGKGSDNGYTIPYPALKGGGSCIMNEGAEGAGVRSLQYSLNECYGKDPKYTLKVDGKYGPKTKATVKYIQSWYNELKEDGIWGPKTGAAFDWVGKKGDYESCVRANV